MKIKLTLALLAISCQWADAQISGNVLSEDAEALPFVNVLLLNVQDSSMVAGGLSDINGNFELSAEKEGSYFLNVRMMGYEDWFSPVFEIGISQSPIKFDNISLEEELTLLEAVQVTAQKMLVEQTMEGMTVNVQSSMAAKGSSALQIIERSPGVVLDRRYNNLTLNGQSGTLIMINGRAVRMPPSEIINMLSGMSADNLEKVELLTNPSAKYDADGGAGIINLVIKKSEDQGTNGSISATAGYGWGPKEAVSLNLNHRKKALNLYGSYSLNHDVFLDGFHAQGSSTSPFLQGEQGFDFTNNNRQNNVSHNTQAGFEAELSDVLIVGGNALYNYSTFNTDIYNDANYSYSDGDFLHADIFIDSKPITDNLSTTLFAERRFGEDSKLNVDVDYIYYSSSSPTQVNSDYSDINGEPISPEREVFVSANRGFSNTSVRVAVAKMDYSQKLGKRVNLESGIKTSFSSTENSAYIDQLVDGDWQRDERNVNDQQIDEKIGAAYTNLNVTLDSLTHLTLGVRYEHWDRQFSDTTPDRSFGKFFPSVFFSRTLTPNASLQLAYNRRITRPSYGDLTTFLRYNGPFSVFTGNSNLQPAITDNIKIGYQFRDKSLAIIYTYEANPIARYQISENEAGDLNLIAPQNLTYMQSLGLQFNIPIQITSWWTFTAGGTLSARKFEVTHTQVPKEKSYVTANLYGTQDFSLPQSFSMELSGFYNAAHYNGSVRNDGFGMLNFGVKKEFQNNSSLQFSITDVFKSMKINFLIGDLTEEAWDSHADGTYAAESARNRIFKLTYFKSFGSTKVKSGKNMNRGSQEERSRVGQ